VTDPADSLLARLVVCGPDGDGNEALLGTTPEFPVPSQWWNHAEPLISAAKAELSLDVTMLRLLRVETGVIGSPDRVTYLVEATPSPRELAPVTARDEDALDEERFRMPWARPGGPAAQLAWAKGALERRGIHLTAPPIQVRSWNLSSIWRLTTSAGTVWLKAVPPFFAHEGAVIERLAAYAVPRLLARDEGICLLADIDGDDLYEPADEAALAMIDALVAMQSGPLVAVDDLLALGLPDWRVPALAGPAARLLDRRGADLDPIERRVLEALIDGLDERHRRLVECGIPDSLVHGDFHPGNARGRGTDITILDWGDTGVGNPLLDMAAFTERMPAQQRSVAQGHWAQRWMSVIPGSDPRHAAEVIAPVSALRQAIIYRGFVDHIERDERVYHETDDLLWLRRTAALLDA
jgi:hypothetical protein